MEVGHSQELLAADAKRAGIISARRTTLHEAHLLAIDIAAEGASRQLDSLSNRNASSAIRHQLFRVGTAQHVVTVYSSSVASSLIIDNGRPLAHGVVEDLHAVVICANEHLSYVVFAITVDRLVQLDHVSACTNDRVPVEL